MSRITKDQLYLGMAVLVSGRSTCSRRSVGCVIVDEDGHVLSMGYNGVASGQPHCKGGVPCPGASSKSGQNLDSCQAIHAEQNAILHLSDPKKAHTVYCTVSPCMSCVKLLLGTSAKRVVFLESYPHPARELWQAAGRAWDHMPSEVEDLYDPD